VATPDSVASLLAQAHELVSEMEALPRYQVSGKLIAIGERLQASLQRADRDFAAARIELVTTVQLRREIHRVGERLDLLLQDAKLRSSGLSKSAPRAPEVIPSPTPSESMDARRTMT
jgi:hypothetical protein